MMIQEFLPVIMLLMVGSGFVGFIIGLFIGKSY